MLATGPARETNLDGYGNPPLEWPRVMESLQQVAALEALDPASRYWLATTRPDGRPHVMPVGAVWRPAPARRRGTSTRSRRGPSMAWPRLSPTVPPAGGCEPMSPIAADVDEFLAAVPPDKRAALEDLRRVIREAAPGVPMFRLNGKNLVSYSAAKNHCSFHVQSPEVMEAHAAELTGFKTTKGSVNFTPDKPIPQELVTTLVKARIAENEKG